MLEVNVAWMTYYGSVQTVSPNFKYLESISLCYKRFFSENNLHTIQVKEDNI